ncbi:MAG: GNAT family N-acetyltransferase [Promicromonosporaceae bacterium]|nr:GNAT family N-acetyltransferase [Promicromonosporaceae bacterium]
MTSFAPDVVAMFAGTLPLGPLAEKGVTGEAYSRAQAETPAEFKSRLEAEGKRVGWMDLMHYLPATDLVQVGRSYEPGTTPKEGLTRRLRGDVDAAAFQAFQETASAEDRDEADVELRHWAATGHFVGDRLVAVASAYPWRGTQIADIGVLVLPEFRGRGLAVRVVQRLAAHCLAQGYAPQYRCAPEHLASAGTARAAGLVNYGTWAVLR